MSDWTSNINTPEEPLTAKRMRSAWRAIWDMPVRGPEPCLMSVEWSIRFKAGEVPCRQCLKMVNEHP